jgi:hypothetical protein
MIMPLEFKPQTLEERRLERAYFPGGKPRPAGLVRTPDGQLTVLAAGWGQSRRVRELHTDPWRLRPGDVVADWDLNSLCAYEVANVEKVTRPIAGRAWIVWYVQSYASNGQRPVPESLMIFRGEKVYAWRTIG